MKERIDYDENGDLDDVAIENVEVFRLERMSSNTIWVRLHRKEGTDVVFWFKTKRGKEKIIAEHQLIEKSRFK